jgi:hypothetical protein
MESGGVEKALTAYAEDKYKQLNTRKQKRAKHIFIQLVLPGEGTENTRRVATKTELGEDNWNFVTTELAGSRLVVTTGDEKTGEKVTLVHEALIREWQRLRDWIETDHEFRSWQECLRTTIREWERNNRDDGSLLRGARLVEAEEWLKNRQADIYSPEREYIEKSSKYQLQEEERWKRLYAKAEKQRRRAEKQRKLAEIKSLEALTQTSRALFLSRKDDLGALIVGVKAGKKLKQMFAQKMTITDELINQTLSYLQEVVEYIREKNRLEGHKSPVYSINFSPDGERLASGDYKGIIKLWNVKEGKEISTLKGHASQTEGAKNNILLERLVLVEKIDI